MASSPWLFDQEITAQSCKSGCVKHVHAGHLPSAYVGPDVLEVGADKPPGWTVQARSWSAPGDEQWFACNACHDVVPESKVMEHRCA